MVRFVTVAALFALLTPAAHAQQPGGVGAVQGEEGRYVAFFGFDSATLDAEARQVVQAAADEYRRTGAARIEVRGYTDTAGDAEYNDALSDRRAEAVAEELIQQGVPPAAITRAAGLGETELLVPTGEGEPEARNRRVEIELERPSPPPVAAAPPPAPAVEAPAPAAGPAEPAQEEWRGLFSLGALYGLNLSEEGDDDDEGIDDDHFGHLAGLNLSFDYAVVDWVALSLEQAGFYNFGEGEGFGGRSAAGLNFTVGLTDVIPYVGGNIGYLYGSGLDDEWFAGPEVGLNIGPVSAKVAYDIPFDRDLEEGIVVATVGLGIRF